MPAGGIPVVWLRLWEDRIVRLPVLNGIGRALGRAVTGRRQAKTHSHMASQTVTDFDIYDDVRVEIDGRKFYATVVTIENERIEVAELATGSRHWISPTQAIGM
jgi:hypothetical protein